MVIFLGFIFWGVRDLWGGFFIALVFFWLLRGCEQGGWRGEVKKTARRSFVWVVWSVFFFVFPFEESLFSALRN